MDAKLDDGLDLLLMLSLGRSGSTFLAKAISIHSEYENAGENRFFWQELIKKPPEQHPLEIARFFSAKFPGAEKILDKTPELYRHLGEINFGNHKTSWLELKRAPDAIEASRNRFLATLRKPKRWLMRIRKYRRDYGARWYVPILQRWYFVGSIFGLGRNRAFSTDPNVSDTYQERQAFDAVIGDLRARVRVVTVDYDAFEETVGALAVIGLSKFEIDGIRRQFKR